MVIAVFLSLLFVIILIKQLEVNKFQIAGEKENNTIFFRRHRRLCSANYEDVAQSLFPLSSADLIGFSCVCLAMAITAKTGISGGGLLIPIMVSYFV